jgi:CxxC-x17-CxxC domain-containing protein
MATGEDRRIICVNCGDEFLFTVGEQAFYAEKGLTHAPTRCKKCRSQRKGPRPEGAAAAAEPAARSAGPAREMYTTTCANCGKETQVPFKPVSGRPVYCRDCFRERKGAAAEPARGARPARPARAPRGESAPTGGRMQGAVKWFNEAKGFGFIQEDGGEELFVHFSAIMGDGLKTLTQGDRVEFDVVPGPKGRQAANVTRLG